MGWSGGNDVFDTVAGDVRALSVSDELALKILTSLIGALQDQDWDTEDESLYRFMGDPIAVEAFGMNDVFPPDE